MELLTTFLSSTAVATGVSIWIGKLISDRLNVKWKKDQDSKIEMLKAEIARNQAAINASVSNLSLMHQVGHERRLKAIETMWEAMNDFKSLCNVSIAFYSVLIQDEYADSLGRFQVPTEYDLFEKANSNGSSVSQHRPFLGEVLWGMFVVYRIALFRPTLMLIKAKERGEAIRSWYDDPLLCNVIGSVLTEEEFQGYKDSVFGGYKSMVHTIEGKILSEINRIISGEMSAEVGYTQTRKWVEAARKAEGLEQL